MDEKNAPIMDHLNELRRVLIISIIALIVGTLAAYIFFLEDAMNLIKAPIASLNIELNFTQVAEAFLTQLKVALLAGWIIASPVILWQIIRFILPALYKHERRIFFALIFSCIFLFVAGIAFGYFFVLRLGLRALLFTFSGGFNPLISAANYVSFVLSFLIPFGLVFEIPLFVYFLTKAGIVNPVLLRSKRKYVILIILILAAMLTPPDIISQLFLALPMMLLYEISIEISSHVYKRKLKKEAKEQQQTEE